MRHLHREARKEPEKCPWTSDCLDFLDALDPNAHFSPQQLSQFVVNEREQRSLERLQSHVQNCLQCYREITKAIQMRDRQRTALLAWLNEEEQMVPSTSGRIMDAIRSESMPEAIVPFRASGKEKETSGFRISTHHRIRTINGVISLVAVAALILFTIRLFHFAPSPRSSPMGSPHNMTPAKPHPSAFNAAIIPADSPSNAISQGWDASGFAYQPDDYHMQVSSYNYRTGHISVMAYASLPTTASFSTFSSDGQTLLSKDLIGDQVKLQTIVSSGRHRVFYQLPIANYLNSIWMPDNRHVLVATRDQGVIELDSQAATSQKPVVITSITTSNVRFFRDNYVYVEQQAGSIINFVRLSLDSGEVQTIAQVNGAVTFWMSPGGGTIYYIQPESGSLLAVNSDGSNPRQLRINGAPVGYGVNGELLFVEHVGSRYQLVQLGDTVDQDQLIIEDLAPGAGSLCPYLAKKEIICEQNVAVSPYGQRVMVQAFYPDGSHKLFLFVPGMQKSKELPQISSSPVQLLGWNKIR